MLCTFNGYFPWQAADDARRHPSYPPQPAGFPAQRAPRQICALDCGRGSGLLSLLLAEHFQRVVAIDASAEQIANVVADAAHSGLHDRSVDLVGAAQVAHWFDLAAFWKEVDRSYTRLGSSGWSGYGRLRLSKDPAIDDLMGEF